MRTRDIINNNIKKYCNERGISYYELSKELNKSSNFIEKMLKNEYKRYPTLDLIDSIARIFNIETICLFDIEKES